MRFLDYLFQKLPELRSELIELWWSEQRIPNSAKLQEFLTAEFLNACKAPGKSRSDLLLEGECAKLFKRIYDELSRHDFIPLLEKFEKSAGGFERTLHHKECISLPKWLLEPDNDIANQYHDTDNELVIYKRDGAFCVYCGISLKHCAWSIDHIFPAVRFRCQATTGHERYKNSYLNVVASCTSCNLLKKDYFPVFQGKDHLRISRMQCVRLIRKKIYSRLQSQHFFRYLFTPDKSTNLAAWIPDPEESRWSIPAELSDHRKYRAISDYRVEAPTPRGQTD